MKRVIKYMCEVCNKEYATSKEAIECEAKGKPNPKDFPIGLMHEIHHHGYVGVFAIAQLHDFHNPHLGMVSWWACRLNKSDSLNDEHCGGSNDLVCDPAEYVEDHFLTQEKLKSAEGKRMVAYLRSKGITPRYYDQFGKLNTMESLEITLR